jgi:glycosyltransferase involved in cell wall biosynthesis
MINILMATYNGEKYISEQIDSVLNQTFIDFKLYINDDCSTDNTKEIVKEYVNKYPDKIFFSQNESNSGNAKYNFMNMILEHGESDYVMFCDQDDVWMKDKIHISIKEMKKQEQIFGKDMPILLHTDLTVVDKNLNIIQPSFEKYADINCSKNAINYLLVENVITGCTAMINQALVKMLEEPKNYYIMHDWYIGLVASTLGIIKYFSKPTVYYRQHDNNALGAGQKNIIKKASIKLKLAVNKGTQNTVLQAKSFLDEYRSKLEEDVYMTIQMYVNVESINKIKRMSTIIKYRFFKYGIIKNIYQILFS